MTFPLNEPWRKDWETYYTASRRINSDIDRLRKEVCKAQLQVDKERAMFSHDEPFMIHIAEKKTILKNAQSKLQLSAKYLKKAKDQEPEGIPNTYSPGHGALHGGPSMMSFLSVAESLLEEVVEAIKGL